MYLSLQNSIYYLHLCTMKWIIKFCSHKIVRKWIENLKKLKLARYNELEREKKPRSGLRE